MRPTTPPSPFHEGEQQVQAMLGVREQIEPWARQVVRHCLPDEHRAFHTALPFLVAAARDREGRPWATLLTGPDGFVCSLDDTTLDIGARPLPGDALQGALCPGADLGLLGIDLETRRRNRVNGTIGRSNARGILFNVDQTFGNCPQHIHARAWRRVPAQVDPMPASHANQVTPAMQAWIRAADTFFIASGHQGQGDNPAYGMDASHRGGQPGFVEIVNETELMFPDYAGNNHYNTIGNLMMDPRAGLLFVDFERGSLLQLTGHTRIDWASDAVARFPGAQRLVFFTVEEAIWLESVLPLRWSGTAGSVRSLRVVKKIRESADVTSFVFAARDGGALTDFEAGQHLPIVLNLPGQDTPVTRTYSLSGGPDDDTWRISVKREAHGLVSRHLHDHVDEQDIIGAHPPAGHFILSKSDRPVVLISAGVGVTPMVSMLHALTSRPLHPPIWFIHGVRDSDHHPLAQEVSELAAGHDHINANFVYSQPKPEDKPGVDYHAVGRINSEMIRDLLPGLDAEFYLCGPTGFMAAIRNGLNEIGVPGQRIHAETFGPTG